MKHIFSLKNQDKLANIDNRQKPTPHIDSKKSVIPVIMKRL
jgi:hypothetical protein